LIEERMQALRTARTEASTEAIRAAIAALEQATGAFAQRRMDVGIRKALSGHRVDEFKPLA
jgi:molecular chaperone HscA